MLITAASPAGAEVLLSPRMMFRAIVCTAMTEMIASIGDRSSGPIIGRIRRNACSSGQTVSLAKSRIAYSTRLYGSVTKLCRMYTRISRM